MAWRWLPGVITACALVALGTPLGVQAVHTPFGALLVGEWSISADRENIHIDSTFLFQCVDPQPSPYLGPKASEVGRVEFARAGVTVNPQSWLGEPYPAWHGWFEGTFCVQEYDDWRGVRGDGEGMRCIGPCPLMPP